jgi:hypothetical protein
MDERVDCSKEYYRINVSRVLCQPNCRIHVKLLLTLPDSIPVVERSVTTQAQSGFRPLAQTQKKDPEIGFFPG